MKRGGIKRRFPPKTARKGITHKGIKRAPKAKNKPKKKSKISIWREWNVPDWAYHRYEGLRG